MVCLSAFNKFGYQNKILNINILFLILTNNFNWLKLPRGTTFQRKGKDSVVSWEIWPNSRV